ncbi:MAG: dihydrolipoyl dehydrogenase [Candidatus Atribacteria bacterium]|nr:dihydrolipoyl dehydrogenase [Candidatus Atribacteria bacterium]
MSDTDVVIIGGGVGGYVAALKGAQLGLKVVLVEKGQIGGVCLNLGCIPTKALVSSAQVWEFFQHAAEYGLTAENVSFEYTEVVKRKDRIVQHLTRGVESLLRARKVQIIKGRAEIDNPGEVTVYQEDSKEKLKTRNIIIATGSTFRKLEIEDIEKSKNIINTDEVLSLAQLPREMLIIGAGYSGIEFASIFNSFGVQIEIVDILTRILLPVDAEVANSLFEVLKKKGIRFSLNSKVQKIAEKNQKLSVLVKNNQGEKEILTEKVLISTGRIPDYEGLNHHGIGIELENNGIKVDQFMRTNIPGIYAIGDVVGKKMLAHVASTQGQIAVQHIAGFQKPMSYRVVPFCVFSNPEVASVGLNEDEAKEKYQDVNVFKFPYLANGKALSMNEQEGYVKMISNKKNNKMIGVHIIGAHASDLIAEASLALQKGCNALDIAETIHAHPTLSETFLEAAEGILGYPIHVIKSMR